MSVETERNLIYLIKQVELGVRRPFLDAVAQHGMNAAQYTALTVLERLPGLTSSELARRSFVRAQTMAETVTGLVDTGLVRRETDPTHGRQMLLFITAAGARRIAEMAEDVNAVEAQMIREMTPAQADVLAELLRASRNGLREALRGE